MTVLNADLRLGVSDSREASGSAVAARFWICAGIFAALMVWAVFFPFSGDGDSVLHYLNAVDTYGHLNNALYAWTRPGYKIPLSLFAAHGIMAAHFFDALITVAVAWNTMKLAAELAIPHAAIAGLLLILQPFVFALGSDTMTEMPMALGLVIAIRLWQNHRRFLACLVVGYLPSVRPEGFFFGLIFGVMVLVEFALRRKESGRSIGVAIGRAIGLLGCLSTGLVAWVLLCWIFSNDHDALLVLHYWSWPPGSYSAYASGSLFHYVINWPVYCGLPLFALFLAGIVPSIRRSMSLPWILWFTVIGVHSILYWRGWFASCGLIRIMACSSPVTALICLYGWNALGKHLGRIAAGVFFLTATAWVVGNYCLDRNRMHFLPLQRCATYVAQNHLLDNKPWFFAGDKIATAMLLGPNLSNDKLMVMDCDKEKIAASLAALPIGSIGIWDTEQAPIWHGHTIEDLTAHGFTVLFSSDVHVYSFASLIRGQWWLDMRYAVLRKDRAW